MLDTKGDKNLFEVLYTLQNNTDFDYRIASEYGIEISAKLQQQKEFSPFADKELTIDFPIFVPARGRVRLPIVLKAAYPVREKYAPAPEEDKQYRADVAAFLTSHAGNLGGFVLFDTISRYEIDFPSGWEKDVKKDPGK